MFGNEIAMTDTKKN